MNTNTTTEQAAGNDLSRVEPIIAGVTSARVEGKVTIANAGKSVYWASGNDGRTYFFHASDIKGDGEGDFRHISVNQMITFEPTLQWDKKAEANKPHAAKVEPLRRSSVRRNADAPVVPLDDRRIAKLMLDGVGRVSVRGVERAIKPEFEAEGMRAYRLPSCAGQRHPIGGFQVTLPEDGEGWVFVLAGANKNVRQQDGTTYGRIEPGSYYVTADPSGSVRIHNLAVRRQGDCAWAVVEERFATTYSLDEPLTSVADLREQVVEQTVAAGPRHLSRDNDGFVTAITEALAARLTQLGQLPNSDWLERVVADIRKRLC